MNHIGNIVLFGNKKSGKTELAKQMVYSIATDTLVEYRVLVFSDNDDYKCILNMPYINENHKIRFQILRIKELDYSYLKKRLLNKKYPIDSSANKRINWIFKKSTFLIKSRNQLRQRGSPCRHHPNLCFTAHNS